MHQAYQLFNDSSAWRGLVSAFRTIWENESDEQVRSDKADVARALVIMFAIRAWAERHGYDDTSKKHFESLVDANWDNAVDEADMTQAASMN